MADFSLNSDSSDEGAVEELINQAMDHSILEQIAKINCSSFSSDSVLPTHLENRFSRLKSFPVEKPRSDDFPSGKRFGGKFDGFGENPVGGDESKGDSRSKASESEENGGIGSKFGGEIEGKAMGQLDSDDGFGGDPDGGNGSKRDLRSGSDYFSSKSVKSEEKGKNLGGLEGNLGTWPQSNSSNSSSGNAIFSPLDENSRRKEGANSKTRVSRSYSSDFSPSPPRKSGCFWCSPKKGSGKKSRGNRGIDGELLSDLSILSAKKQQKLLERSMREEKKINREAEKIIKWAKQCSARMNIPDIDD